MKITLNALKPRNPFVAASLRRMAGAHRNGNGARRQQARRELRQAVDASAAERSRHSP